MEAWKKAFSLASFELKASWKSIFTFILSLVIITTLFASMFSELGQKLKFFHDLLFLIIFTMLPSWIRTKEFQFQKIGEETWGTPYFIFLHQMAIPKEILLKSRFINYFILAIPLHVLLFVLLFIFSEARNVFSFGEYIVFSVIWICFGIYAGALFPASDTGDNISNFKLTIYTILLILGIGGLFFFVYFIFGGHGIVYWSMEAAKQWPLIASILSILLAIAGVKYWLHYAARNMQYIDYFK